MTDEAVTLADGTVAHLVAGDDGWSLEVDGIRQSHVGTPSEPPTLASARWMLAALGAGRSRSAHLGGGLLTLPRALAAHDPASQQVVIESEPALVEVVRDRLGVPDSVHLEVGDARAWLDAGTASELDAVVIDVFAGGRIPPAFTSRECFAAAHAALGDGGVLVVNSVAGPDLTFTRREIATLQAEFAHVAMIVQGSALHGLRFGNAVLVASDAALDVDGIRAALAGDASRGALVTDLDPIVDGAEPVCDTDGLWSPVPDLPDVSGALRLLDATREAVRGVLPSDR